MQVIRELSALGLVGEADPLTGLSTVAAYSRDTYEFARHL